MHLAAAALVCLSLLAVPALAADWPQWRGPDRNGVSAETDWMTNWPAAGGAPRVAWAADVGKGHAAVSVVGDRVYTMGWDAKSKRDTVWCLDLATGKVLWQQSYPSEPILQWPGPRATPTVSTGVVYTLGQHGQLRAWDAQTGAPKWAIDLPPDYNPDIDYGFAWSPLVTGDVLLLGTGGRGLAVRAKDGSFAWGNDGKKGACASPVPYTWNGKPGVALMTINGAERESLTLYGIDPSTGNEQWRFGPWAEKWGAACVDPVVFEGRAFITSAEQHRQCALVDFRAGGNAKIVWSNNHLTS